MRKVNKNILGKANPNSKFAKNVVNEKAQHAVQRYARHRKPSLHDAIQVNPWVRSESVVIHIDSLGRVKIYTK